MTLHNHVRYTDPLPGRAWGESYFLFGGKAGNLLEVGGPTLNPNPRVCGWGVRVKFKHTGLGCRVMHPMKRQHPPASEGAAVYQGDVHALRTMEARGSLG